MELQYINAPRTRTNLPFSDAVRAGDTYYLAGRIGLDETGRPPAEAAEEARLVMQGLRAVLQACGLEMKNLAQVTVYASDVSLFETFNAEYVRHFEGALPARAFLGSGPLLFEARFEVTAIAVAGPA